MPPWFADCQDEHSSPEPASVWIWNEAGNGDSRTRRMASFEKKGDYFVKRLLGKNAALVPGGVNNEPLVAKQGCQLLQRTDGQILLK